MLMKKFLKAYYFMMLPGFIWLFLFTILPMRGILMAFENFSPVRGIFRSPWIGLENFAYMFSMGDVAQVFINTVSIAVGKMTGNLIVPLVFALLLNELKLIRLKRPIQTIVYLPHFLSWVILAGILLDLFGTNGPVNQIRVSLGKESILFFAKPELFPFFIILSDVWKSFGFNAIVYLAALMGINPNLHEAAAIDGCNRFMRIIHVNLPGIKSTIILLATLSLGSVLNAGFDQVFNLYNPLVYSTGDIIDTWVYRIGLQSFQYSLATTVGLLKSVISFALISFSYSLASRFAGYRIF
ncbi:sugar ABC transporter permease [Spirochaetia bacterium]|nr:sugar ABC transporter permease [Spirochaetia bacterium]